MSCQATKTAASPVEPELVSHHRPLGNRLEHEPQTTPQTTQRARSTELSSREEPNRQQEGRNPQTPGPITWDTHLLGEENA